MPEQAQTNRIAQILETGLARQFTGGALDDGFGRFVSYLGDIDGDGHDDFAIRASESGRDTTIIFGQADFFDPAGPAPRLATLEQGGQGYANAFADIAAAGDVNGDGLDDMVYVRDGDHEVTVIFGTTAGFGAQVDPDTLDPGAQWTLSYDRSGGNLSVASAGDVNGDGLDDLLVGDWRADGDDFLYGRATVVYGSADPATRPASVDGLSFGQGFTLIGEGYPDWAGQRVASAGDVNGDGYDDILVGARDGATIAGSTGHAYLVYGGPGARPLEAVLTPAAGSVIRFDGTRTGDNAGSDLTGIGDFDGDGLDDFVIGSGRGYAAVIFGSDAPLSPVIDLGALSPQQGFLVQGGGSYGEAFGARVAAAGDVNGDGYADLLLSDYGGRTGSDQPPGEVVVLFGAATRPTGPVLREELTRDTGLILGGMGASDRFGIGLAGGGDVNGDGRPDLLAGAQQSSFDGGTAPGPGYAVVVSDLEAIADNVAPSAFDETLDLVVGGAAGQVALLANDLDLEGGLTLSEIAGQEITGPVSDWVYQGLTYSVGPDGSIGVRALPEAFADLADGETAQVRLAYTVRDAFGLTDTAQLVVTVSGRNDAPVPSLIEAPRDDWYGWWPTPTAFGQVLPNDPDGAPSDSYTMTLTDDAGGKVALVGDMLYWTTDILEDRATAFTFEVAVRDAGGQTGTLRHTWTNTDPRLFAEDGLGLVHATAQAEHIILTEGADTVRATFDTLDNDTIRGFGLDDVLVIDGPGRDAGAGTLRLVGRWGPSVSAVDGPTLRLQVPGLGAYDDPVFHLTNPEVRVGAAIITERDDGQISVFGLPVLPEDPADPLPEGASGSGPDGLRSGAHLDDVEISVATPAGGDSAAPAPLWGHYILDEASGVILSHAVFQGGTDPLRIEGLRPGQRIGLFLVPEGAAALDGLGGPPELTVVDGALRIRGYAGPVFGSDFDNTATGVSVVTGGDPAGSWRLAMRFDTDADMRHDDLWLMLKTQDILPEDDRDGNRVEHVHEGTDAAERFDAGGGDDTLLGHGGDDTLIGGTGADSIDGGAGIDTAVWLAARDAVLVQRSGDAILVGADGRIDIVTNVERFSFAGEVMTLEEALGLVTDDPTGSADGVLEGGAQDDVLIGRDGTDYATGGDGADLVHGGLGDDTLSGGAGDDTLFAGHVPDDGHSYGIDLIEGGAGNDEIHGANGAATLRGGEGDDTLWGGNDLDTADIDLLEGGAGNDSLVSGQSWVATRARQSQGDVLRGGDGADTAIGGRADDLIEGGAGSDLLIAGDRAAVLTGALDAAGADSLYGEHGDDTLHGADGGQLLDGGAGDDWLFGGQEGASADTDTLLGGGGNDRLASGQTTLPTPGTQANGDLLDGQWGADTLRGGYADDTLIGGAGHDLLEGGWGDDLLIVGLIAGAPDAPAAYGHDSAHGGAGNDRIEGGNGANLLTGDEGNDTIIGGDDLFSADADTLIGGAGDDLLISGQVRAPDAASRTRGDWLEGGAGNDTLVGGLAEDRFVFADVAGVDEVRDFETGADLIDLTGFGAGISVQFVQAGADVEMSVDGALVAVFTAASVAALDDAGLLLA